MKKDEKIIEQGITNENLYKVKSGTVRVEKQLPDGSKKLLVKLGANETFGDTSVLQSLATATASVIADSDQVVLRVIQIDLVFEIFKNNPGLCMRFYRQMATKLAERLRNLHKAPLPKKEELRAELTDGPGSASSTNSSGEHSAPSLTERLSTRNLKRISVHSADLDSNSGTSTPRDSTPVTDRKREKKEKEKDKKKQVVEVSFHEKFDLPLTEVVIKEVRCEIKMSTSKKPGQMYISQRYVCFDSSLFGSHTKVSAIQYRKLLWLTIYFIGSCTTKQSHWHHNEEEGLEAEDEKESSKLWTWNLFARSIPFMIKLNTKFHGCQMNFSWFLSLSEGYSLHMTDFTRSWF